MKKLLFFTGLSLILCSGFCFHKFYVSHTQIEYNTAEKSLQVSVKIFTDDLETALKKAGYPDTYLGTEKQHPAATSRVNEYLEKGFTLMIPGEKYARHFVGFEKEADVTWCYIEYNGLKKTPESVNITSTLLTEVFSDQINIIDMKINGKQHTEMLTRTSNNVVITP